MPPEVGLLTLEEPAPAQGPSLAVGSDSDGGRSLVLSENGSCSECCGCVTLRRYDRCSLDSDHLPCAPEFDHVWLCDPPRCPAGVSYQNACFTPTTTTIPADQLPDGEVFIPDAEAVCSSGCLPTCTSCTAYYRAAACQGRSIVNPAAPAFVYIRTTCVPGGCRMVTSSGICYTIDVGTRYFPSDLPANATVAPCGAVSSATSCCNCMPGCTSNSSWTLKDCATGLPIASGTCCCGSSQSVNWTATLHAHFQLFDDQGNLTDTYDADGTVTFTNGAYVPTCGDPRPSRGNLVCGTHSHIGPGTPFSEPYNFLANLTGGCKFNDVFVSWSPINQNAPQIPCIGGSNGQGWQIDSRSQSYTCASSSYSISGRYVVLTGNGSYVGIVGTQSYTMTWTDDVSARCGGGCGPSGASLLMAARSGPPKPSPVVSEKPVVDGALPDGTSAALLFMRGGPR